MCLLVVVETAQSAFGYHMTQVYINHVVVGCIIVMFRR